MYYIVDILFLVEKTYFNLFNMPTVTFEHLFEILSVFFFLL